MSLHDLHFLQQALSDKGVDRVQIYRDRELKFCCPLGHEDSNPSAYLIVDKGFFKCFSCGKTMSAPYFLKKMGIRNKLSESFLKQKKYSGLPLNRFSNKPSVSVVPKDYKRGLALFSEAGDYRIFPDVVGYLKSRLGEGFKLPPFVSIRKTEDRNSLIYKGKELLITEKFGKSSKLRFLNYGDNCLMHHISKPVQDLVVVEGFFDYLKVYQLYPNVCALMTTSLSGNKLAQLSSISIDRVWVFTDNDSGGISARDKLSKRLISIGRRPRSIEYQSPCLTDPGAMNYTELKEHLKEIGINVHTQ